MNALHKFKFNLKHSKTLRLIAKITSNQIKLN